MKDKPQTKNHEQWNEEMAKRYNPDDFINRTGFVVRWMESLRINKSVKMLDCQDNDHVLDLGCGAGNLTVKMKGAKIIGVDLSQMLIGIARERCQKMPNVEIKKGDAEKIESPDNFFDRLICSEVMEHVQNPQKVLQEMHRVMKSTGRVIITVPNEDLINQTKKIVIKVGLKKWVAGEYNMSDNMLDEWHVSEITEEWMKDNVKNLFKIETVLNIPFAFFPYHRGFVLSVIK